MSNELNNIISRNTNGVYEGVAIGGDRYPGSVFIDHLFRFQVCGLLLLWRALLMHARWVLLST
jgi:ATP citrate (pro-S)-lyase